MKIKVDKNNILSQMFDVRPRKKSGILNTEKILSVGKMLDLKEIEENLKSQRRRYLLDLGEYANKKPHWFESLNTNKIPIEEIYSTEREIEKEEASKFKDFYKTVTNNSLFSTPIKIKAAKEIIGFENTKKEEYICNVREAIIEENFDKVKDDLKEFGKNFKKETEKALAPITSGWKKSLAIFAISIFTISSSVGVLAFYQKESGKAKDMKNLGMQGFGALIEAKESIENKNFPEALQKFQFALDIFEKGQKQISAPENLLAKIPDFFNTSNLSSSGIHLINVGQHISSAGVDISSAIMPIFNVSDSDIRITSVLSSSKNLLDDALNEISLANNEIKKVDGLEFPENISGEIVSLKEKLPQIAAALRKTSLYSESVLKILGSENPRKYLLIFQNNAELRANGGFIGSYGVADVYKGKISDVKVDGIYDPAGQLSEKIIPPLPFKKVADKWNIFDANYFADFLTSAKKISWFYEKTGGPTVDGVIAFTPQVLEDLLRITGPIELEEFNKTISAQNFIDEIQYEVEEGYDKTENQPKKIVSSLAQKLLEKIMDSKQEDWGKFLPVLQNNLRQKHILLYFSDSGEERMASEENWTGEVLNAEMDYLQIVHTNINGYKTDKMIQEEISHEIEITSSGSVFDTVAITKKHTGGKSEYDWYNRQNGDFLRIYAPQDSKLVSAEGFSTEEIYSLTKDFSGFKTDPDVDKIEKTMKRNKESGAFTFEESGKQVFAGWMYTNPGENSTVKIKYQLPFKVSADDFKYNILYQKQSGFPGSKLNVKVTDEKGKVLKNKTVEWVGDEYLNFYLQN